MSWEKKTLGDVANIFSGYAFKSIEMNSVKGTPLLKIKNIFNMRVSKECETFLNPDVDLNKYARFELQKDDFLVAMTGQGSVGRIGKMHQYSPGYYVNQRVAIVRVDCKNVNPSFIFSQVATTENEIELFKKANGAGQPNISAKQIGELSIILPPIETQKKIADILSAYDDLIENNQKQIKLLEEAAQRLYKEWFIDLHFPGHESTPIIDGIPQGWKKEKLGKLVPILTGKKDANFGTENGEYPFFTCSQEPIKAPSYSFDTSAVILAGNGDFNVKLYRGKFEAYQRTYVLSPYEEKYLYLLYYAVNDNMTKFIKGASGSTIKFLTKGMIENVEISIPDNALLEQFNAFMEGIQSKVECLKSSITNATEARDRLLPKLMNGEIEVTMEKTVKVDKFENIRKHWQNTPYDKDLPLAARSTGEISEETLEKLKEIAEEE